jgi:hypothetical protein
VPGLIPEVQLKALADWLSKNKPTDRKPNTGSPAELPEVPPSKPEATTNAGNSEQVVTESPKKTS